MRRLSDLLVEDREFEVGGEVFKWRYPYWEEFADRAEADMKIVTDGTQEDKTVKDIYQDFIDRIAVYIDPENDAVTRWHTLAQRKKDPVPAFLFVELYQWLVEVTSNRPTEQPLPSENGQGQTVPTSTAGSS